MMFAIDTVTLYIKHVDATTKKDVWTRVVLNGVLWTQKVVSGTDSNGTLQLTHQTTVMIPVDVYAGTRAYKDPKDYLALTTVQRLSAWTLKKGDVMVLDECAAVISDSYRISKLKEDEDTYCNIVAVTDNTHRDMLNHWQVELL